MELSAAVRNSAIVSLNPPQMPSNPAEVEELNHRLVIGIALGVHSGRMVVSPAGHRETLQRLPILGVLLETMIPTFQPQHVYRFYFAYDFDDSTFKEAKNREAINAIFAEKVAAEDAKRWHPPNSRPGVIDGSRLVVSVHWVRCDFSGKPSWAHSDAVVAAYKEGADYVFRTNDDSTAPKTPDWVDRVVAELRGRQPVPNLGVSGPTCHEGATQYVDLSRTRSLRFVPPLPCTHSSPTIDHIQRMG